MTQKYKTQKLKVVAIGMVLTENDIFRSFINYDTLLWPYKTLLLVKKNEIKKQIIIKIKLFLNEKHFISFPTFNISIIKTAN